MKNNNFYRNLRKNVMNPINDVNPINNVWVFHHTDADGYCSGSVTYLALKEKLESLAIEINAGHWHLVPSDYNTDFSKFNIQSNDIVAFVDLSFTENTIGTLISLNYMTSNIIWIDHHESDVDVLNKRPDIEELVEGFVYCAIGDRNNRYSAALICWAILYDKDPSLAPRYVKLVSDWDTWTHSMPESIYFNEYISSSKDYKLVLENEINTNSVWFKLFEESKNKKSDTPLLDEAIETGKPIVESQKIKNARYLRSNGFLSDIFGYTALVCNQKSNSLLFGDDYKKYDLVCPFVLQERNGKLIYTYSLFSSNEEINCKEIAEQFGGGGHRGAAGFSLPINIFTCSSLRLKWTLFKIKKSKNKKRTNK